jgi:hypothetical protein
MKMDNDPQYLGAGISNYEISISIMESVSELKYPV